MNRAELSQKEYWNINPETVLVEVQEITLSDGSKTYDVVIESARWFAVTKDDAGYLQEAIVEAGRKHANNDTVAGFIQVLSG